MVGMDFPSQTRIPAAPPLACLLLAACLPTPADSRGDDTHAPHPPTAGRASPPPGRSPMRPTSMRGSRPWPRGAHAAMPPRSAIWRVGSSSGWVTGRARRSRWTVSGRTTSATVGRRRACGSAARWWRTARTPSRSWANLTATLSTSSSMRWWRSTATSTPRATMTVWPRPPGFALRAARPSTACLTASGWARPSCGNARTRTASGGGCTVARPC